MPRLETRFSGSVPENYDRGLGPFIFSHYAQEMADRCAALGPCKVLETAAGTGIVTEYLRERIGPDALLVSTDLNQPMLDYAASKPGTKSIVDFVAADACNLPLADNQFDAIVCQFGVMFYPDKQASYAEALRVLKPSGTYLFSVWDRWSENPFAEIAYNVAAEFCADDPPAFYKVPFSYNDINAIKDALEHAGFASYKHETLPHNQQLFDVDLFAHGLVYGNPLHDELVERGIEPKTVCNRLAEVLCQQLGESMPLKAIFFSATKT